MNVEDYRKIYLALTSKDVFFSSVDDIVKKLNISCYDAIKQAVFDFKQNSLMLVKSSEDSRECDSLKQCLSYSSYIGVVLSYNKPDFLDLFIEENKDTLSKFSIVKFLGSGQVGDAWELEEGRILKIFDNSVQNDIVKYEQAKEVLDEADHSSGYDVSIYEIGRLKVPDKYFGIKTPSFSYIRVSREDKPEYEPAYVVLEKLTTYESLVGSYASGLSESQSLPESLVKSGLPEDKPFRDAIRHNNDPEFVVDIFMTYIGDIIIQSSIRGWYDNTINHYSSRNYPMDLNSILSQRTEVPFLNRKQRISGLAEMYIDELELNSNFPEPRFFEAYVSILKSARPNLPDDWLLRLAESTISKLEMGHKDVHTGNVGIRAQGDLSFVYYDS